MDRLDVLLLEEFFTGLDKQLDGMDDVLLALGYRYPRLTELQMYIDLRKALLEVKDNTNGIADYVHHATDENWLERKE